MAKDFTHSATTGKQGIGDVRDMRGVRCA